MQRTTIAILISILLLPAMAATAYAAVPADTDTVRLMLTAPDNQDFSMFEEESLIAALIDIIRNDRESAVYHERVVTSALAVLGELHPPEAVDVLIGKLDEYPTTCLYWLGTYASADGLAAMIPYLSDEDASARCEAAVAIGNVPDGDPEDDEWAGQLVAATQAMIERLHVEEDEAVQDAIRAALAHIAGMNIQGIG